MNLYLLYFSFSFYLMAGVLYLVQVVFPQTSLHRHAFRLTFLACMLQSIMLLFYFIEVGYPFLVDVSVSYLFSAWVAAAAFLLLHLWQRYPLVGVAVLPIITTFYLLAQFSRASYNETLLQSPWASVHIVFSFLALAIFALTFVLGILFIIEEFQLKHKVLPKLFLKMPSLESLEKVHARALSVGFTLLTAGIMTGAAWAKSVTGFYFFEDARQLWAVIAWLIYALFLQSRWLAGWRGRRGVLLSLLGFVVILFTFLGVDHA